MMEIIYKGSHELVTEYSVGDVIQADSYVYMIVQITIDNYAAVNLSYATTSDKCSSLEELYDETHVSGERKVKATVVIEGEES